MNEDFLLESSSAAALYHSFAAPMPIIDFHCHLPAEKIAANSNFKTITEAWLEGDHYKWRAMRANGVSEHYITGAASDYEKFEKWAETVPYTLRNPLYHWTHLELRRYFNITDILSPSTARRIYDRCNEMLGEPEFSTRGLLKKMNVRTVFTTNDATDDLAHHQSMIKLAGTDQSLQMLPTFRPDKAMNCDDGSQFAASLSQLEALSGEEAGDFTAYLSLLKKRHQFFTTLGCRASDHGIPYFYAETYTGPEIETIFLKLRQKAALTATEAGQFKSAMLHQFAIWDYEAGLVQQYHFGALRNTNSRRYKLLGPDTGFDSMGDFSQALPMAAFLDKLDQEEKLAKTILYNLNPADNELIASMAGNFQDSTPGKIQLGAAWWFLDQKDGITRQLNALSNMGLLSRFVGMITDSRSFLSFPRHEYFRRILCNVIGNDVENGELPNDIPWLGKMVSAICYTNAKEFFNL